VKNDLRLIDAAVDQYAIEHNRSSGSAITARALSYYLKSGTRLQVAAGAGSVTDQLGNAIVVPSVDSLPKIPTASHTALSDVADASFWAPYSIN